RRTIVSLTVLLLAAACGPPPEYPLLQRFFAASRLRDTTALQQAAPIVFEPREQGVVTEFTITSVAARREGSRELEDVTIDAPVRPLGGEPVRQTLVVTIERIDGRWLVVAVRRP